MKKIILIAITFIAIKTQAQTPIADSVTTGAGYANQVWYSLQSDEQGTQLKDNWDLGIEMSGFNASILVNTQKNAGLAAYATPFTAAQWRTFDTVGYKNWTSLYNSDTLWDIGALNKSGTYNTADLGWGTYDQNTHLISGTRLFLIKTGTTTPKFMKLLVKSLASGTYTITYANIDNSDSTTFTVSKSNYANRNFVYYDFTTKALVDLEPSNKTWDITFTKYIYNNYPAGGGTFIPYPVTGVLHNKTVKVAEIRKTAYSDVMSYSSNSFTSRISEIGSDFKTYYPSTFSWKVTDSLTYLIQDVDKNIWKVAFTKFTGSGTGKYFFTKTKMGNLSTASINKNNTLSVYPNPCTKGNNIVLASNIEDNFNQVKITLTDINGKIIYIDTKTENKGFNAIEISDNLPAGIYFISLQCDNKIATQKLIIQ